MTHHKHCTRLGWPGVESCEICDAITAAVAEKQEWCAKVIPTSWLDPMLSGPKSVMVPPPWGCQDIERLLHHIRTAIRAGEGKHE